MKNNVQLILLVVFAVFVAACGGGATESSGKLKVVTTTGQLGDAVANIGGDTLELASLLGPGIDPHLYVPTEGDVGKFSSADVIFYNGINLEAQMSRIMAQMGERGKIVVSVGDSMPESDLLNWEGEGKAFDPHIWNDPVLWSQGVELIRDMLMEADPDNADVYEANTKAYLAEIAETHAYVTELINSIPESQRVMITAHDAFAYFGRTYGLEVAGLQGISTESEAGTADVQNLAAFIIERGVPAMFVETSVPARTIEAVQAAVQAQGAAVEIGGSLFSDALGEAGTAAATYNGMLRHNAETLTGALGGTVTE
ncbi:MAG: metal ABC transporter solute-binding protein, Zn/Mn family [Candidatus Promineifilaceae bacterium]